MYRRKDTVRPRLSGAEFAICAILPAMAELLVMLTCPVCAHATQETMPTDRCVILYECRACHSALRPKAGDCCVFCSYGDKRCPFVQDSCDCPGVDSSLVS